MAFEDRSTVPQVDFDVLDRLFAELVALPPSRRAERLAAIDDPALRTAVGELLDADATDGPLDHEPTPTPTPRRIGTYRVDAEIGRGGMGVVYRARDDALGRDVAVKVLHREVAERPDALRRLRREARALAALNHPHIATLYGLEEERPADGGRLYLVLEYIEGESLGDRLRHRPLAWREAVEITRQVACALEAAHKRDLVHRDVKPANIRFDHRGSLKLLDFGLARSVADDPGSDSAITEARAVFGTASYMSPEQARGETVDARSDVWAFGCVLFECLAGTRAFDAGHPLDTLSSVLHDDPPWHRLPADLPADLTRILRLCLRRDPEDRWQTIGDVRRQLDDIALRSTAGRRVVVRRGSRRLGRLAALAAAALLGALAALVATRLDDGRAEAPWHSPTPRFTTLDLPAIDGLPVHSLLLTRDASAVLVQSYDRLWRRRLDRFETDSLPASDGRALLFDDDGHSVLVANRTELAWRTLQQDHGRVIATGHWAVQGATRAEEGTLILAPSWSGPLHRLAAGATEPTPWTTLDRSRGEVSHRWPQALPGGRVVFTIKTNTLRSFDDAILAIAEPDGSHREIWRGGSTPHWVAGDGEDLAADIPGYLFQVHDGRLLVAPFDPAAGALLSDPRPLVERVMVDERTGEAIVDFADDGTLVYLERSAGEPAERELVLWPEGEPPELWLPAAPRRASYTSVRLSPDGDLVAIGVIEANTSIWLYDFTLRSLQPFVDGLGNVFGPVWNPTGDALAFVWDRPEGRVIAARSFADKRAIEILLPEATDVRHPVSWIDSRLYFLRTGELGDTDLWVLDLESGEARPVAATAGTAEHGTVSPVCGLLALHIGGRLPGGGRRTALVVRPADAPDGGSMLSTRARAAAWHPRRCELTWVESELGDAGAEIEVVSRALDVDGRPAGPERRRARPELAGFELAGLTDVGELFGYRAGDGGSSVPYVGTVRLVYGWRSKVRRKKIEAN